MEYINNSKTHCKVHCLSPVNWEIVQLTFVISTVLHYINGIFYEIYQKLAFSTSIIQSENYMSSSSSYYLHD